MIKIIPDNGCFELITPYDSDFVTDLKALIPYGQRTYNRDRKTWSIGGKYGQLIQDLCLKYFGKAPELPKLNTSASKLGLLTIFYLGRTKQRADGSRSAFGWMQRENTLLGSMGGWDAIFPEKVLKNFFEPSSEAEKIDAPTGNHYEVLGIKIGSSTAEIKAAYRRMVKQWHPDVCKDPDAHEIFIRIQNAYETLNDPKLKARYDVGLRFEARQAPQKKMDLPDYPSDYRAPLKCGAILCEYSKIGSRYIIERIISWDDIYNPQGQTLVSSWEKDATEPTFVWA